MSEMRLSTLEFIRLLPQFMCDDCAVRGLAAAIDQIVPDIAESCAKLSTWDHIDDMTEEELDSLAWELNILWYDYGATLETKRALVKDSDMVYQRLGTKWAVENVIQTYFGDGYIREWFEYGGDPGYFRVYSTNPTLTSERLTEFMNILDKVKRYSSKLEGIYITLTGQMNLAAGIGIREASRETYKIGSSAPA